VPFSTFACAPSMLCSASKRIGAASVKRADVNWLRHLVLRWGARNLSLVCPHCRHPASSPTLRRGRYMLGDETLLCDHCGVTSVVTFWRFEGLSCRADRPEARRAEALPDPRH